MTFLFENGHHLEDNLSIADGALAFRIIIEYLKLYIFEKI